MLPLIALLSAVLSAPNPCAAAQAAPQAVPAAKPAAAPAATFHFEKGDHVCLIGSALAERLQHDGWFETLLQERVPELELTVRNLGYSGDEVTTQLRVEGCDTWDQQL